MSTKTDNDIRGKLVAVIESGITEDTTKAINSLAEKIGGAIEDDIMYRIRTECAEHLSAWVADLAGRAVTMMLEGNEQMMRQYLSCSEYSYNARSGDHNIWPQDIVDQHPIIHGKLFEQGCIALRKQIVDAHPELLKNERILDLEDQVKSLVSQVNKAHGERDAMWERLRPYET